MFFKDILMLCLKNKNGDYIIQDWKTSSFKGEKGN